MAAVLSRPTSHSVTSSFYEITEFCQELGSWDMPVR
jgi:hypothetical protein